MYLEATTFQTAMSVVVAATRSKLHKSEAGDCQTIEDGRKPLSTVSLANFTVESLNHYH